MAGNACRLRTFVSVLSLAAAATLLRPAPVSACSGGMAFDWAVAHTRGWIATATVVTSEYVPYGFYRIRLDDVVAIKGRPPQFGQLTVAMGAVCDQTPDAGDRILALDGVAIEPAFDRPVVYVIRGADAVPAVDVSRALRSLPATDATSTDSALPSIAWNLVAWLVAVGFGTARVSVSMLARRAEAAISRPETPPDRSR